jgi:phosphate-selective porin OprO and OprP
MNKLLFTLMLVALSLSALAQTEVDERAVISFDKGLGFFAPDSTFGLNLRFRMQNRIAMNTISGNDISPQSFEANVRRLRLRFDGFLGTSKLTYYLQLSFSRGDQDWDVSGFPGIVRDAMVFYTFNEHFYMGMGQGKLPGNRQRVTSSGQQQFTDRSLANTLFNIDRDFGMMAYYSNHLNSFHYNLKGAISSGEGRNVTATDNGLAYTGRLELLPLGPFLSDGDFSEGDLEREPSPKISIGATYSLNHRAKKTLGQRGFDLPTPADITSSFLDVIAKYQGWAFQTELANRMAASQPGLAAGQPELLIFTGMGINTQLSYVFHNNLEIAARYTHVKPEEEILPYEPLTNIYTIGLNKYLAKHRNKLQLNISYRDNNSEFFTTRNFWNIMFQVEVGI